MSGAVLLALVPVASLIGLGLVLRRSGFLADAFWPQAERLAYHVLLPCLFVHGLATARLDAVPVASLAAALVLSTLAVAAALVAAEPRLGLDGAAFTSVFQGGVRFNSYVGVTLAAGLFGAQGVALAAACVAAIVPTVNVLCVLVFARYGAVRPTPRGVARTVALNPLVLGCLSGAVLRAAGAGLPAAVEPVLRALGQASLPLGLPCVGAALEPGAARGWSRPVLAASVAKFALMPLAAALARAGLGLHGPAAGAVLLFQTLPTASSSYIMARQLGGDAPLSRSDPSPQARQRRKALPRGRHHRRADRALGRGHPARVGRAARFAGLNERACAARPGGRATARPERAARVRLGPAHPPRGHGAKGLRCGTRFGGSRLCFARVLPHRDDAETLVPIRAS